MLAFAAVVTVLIAIPGPSALFTVSRALTVGRRAALLTVVGNELGLCGQVVAVAFGVAAVAERVTPVRPLRARAPAGPGAVAHPGIAVPGHRAGPGQCVGGHRGYGPAVAGRVARRLALIGGTGGLVMIGLGISVAATGRQD